MGQAARRASGSPTEVVTRSSCCGVSAWGEGRSRRRRDALASRAVGAAIPGGRGRPGPAPGAHRTATRRPTRRRSRLPDRHRRRLPAMPPVSIAITARMPRQRPAPAPQERHPGRTAHAAGEGDCGRERQIAGRLPRRGRPGGGTTIRGATTPQEPTAPGRRTALACRRRSRDGARSGWAPGRGRPSRRRVPGRTGDLASRRPPSGPRAGEGT